MRILRTIPSPIGFSSWYCSASPVTKSVANGAASGAAFTGTVAGAGAGVVAGVEVLLVAACEGLSWEVEV